MEETRAWITEGLSFIKIIFYSFKEYAITRKGMIGVCKNGIETSQCPYGTGNTWIFNVFMYSYINVVL